MGTVCSPLVCRMGTVSPLLLQPSAAGLDAPERAQRSNVDPPESKKHLLNCRAVSRSAT